MNLENLSASLEGKTLVVTLNRPAKLNAINIQTLAELREVMQEVAENAEIGGMILTGAGEKAFAAGADIAEFAEVNELTGRKFAESGQDTFFMLENSAKPVIGAVNGYALGGGCELAMACHMRVATANARFGQPEVSLGLIPGYGGTQRLTQLVGKGKAMEMILTGDTIGAEEALVLGLVNHVVSSQEELMAKCHQILNKIYTKAPIAVGNAIECINAVYAADDGYQKEANSFANCCKTADYIEGTAAFLEKRTPAFMNR
jgi:enoyl-CoA hydratase